MAASPWGLALQVVPQKQQPLQQQPLQQQPPGRLSPQEPFCFQYLASNQRPLLSRTCDDTCCLVPPPGDPARGNSSTPHVATPTVTGPWSSSAFPPHSAPPREEALRSSSSRAMSPAPQVLGGCACHPTPMVPCSPPQLLCAPPFSAWNADAVVDRGEAGESMDEDLCASLPVSFGGFGSLASTPASSGRSWGREALAVGVEESWSGPLPPSPIPIQTSSGSLGPLSRLRVESSGTSSSTASISRSSSDMSSGQAGSLSGESDCECQVSHDSPGQGSSKAPLVVDALNGVPHWCSPGAGAVSTAAASSGVAWMVGLSGEKYWGRSSSTGSASFSSTTSSGRVTSQCERTSSVVVGAGAAEAAEPDVDHGSWAFPGWFFGWQMPPQQQQQQPPDRLLAKDGQQEPSAAMELLDFTEGSGSPIRAT